MHLPGERAQYFPQLRAQAIVAGAPLKGTGVCFLFTSLSDGCPFPKEILSLGLVPNLHYPNLNSA